jgi:hypothetical protein
LQVLARDMTDVACLVAGLNVHGDPLPQMGNSM